MSVCPRVQSLKERGRSQRGRCKGHPHAWQWCNRAFERNQGLAELLSGLWLPLCTASCAHKGPRKVERAFCLSSPPLSCVSCPCVHTLPTLSPISTPICTAPQYVWNLSPLSRTQLISSLQKALRVRNLALGFGACLRSWAWAPSPTLQREAFTRAFTRATVGSDIGELYLEVGDVCWCLLEIKSSTSHLLSICVTIGLHPNS